MPSKDSKQAAAASLKADLATAPPSAAASNIVAIAEMERHATDCRTVGERMGDAIARQAGRLWFITSHAVWFVIWILWNVGGIPGLRPFDVYPFQFLTFAVSLEAIFLSLFILMSQNRATRQADERAHLDLQINLLSEQESTKILQLLQKLCEHHKLPIANDAELELLKSPTQPETLLKEIKENLPDAC